MNKKKEIIIESVVFVIISLSTYLYVRKNNPDNVIQRYYMTQSKILYNLFNISTIILKVTLFFNLKFLVILIIKHFML